jgi:type I restriction enzyme S subunit
MIDGVKPYPEYKDSGVQWLGEIPAHWKIRRLKHTAPESGKKLDAQPTSLPYVGLENIESGTGRLLLDDSAQDIQGTVVRFNEGDILFGKLRPYLAKVVLTDFDGVGSTELLVFRTKPEVNANFLFYQLLSNGFINTVDSLTYGAKMPRANSDQIGKLSVTIPPFEEQTQIAQFLDHISHVTRRYIRVQRRLIELLEEQKHALIQHAVTRGLAPDVPLKDSGIEWLEQIPEHWGIVPLKNLSNVQSGLTLGKNYLGKEITEYPYLRVANVQDGHLDLSEVKTVSITREDAARSTLQYGDVLMTEGGDPDKLGRGCVWEDQISPCLHQNHIFAVRPNLEQLNPHFLAALLTSRYAKTYFLRTAKQTTNLASTNKTTIGQFPVLLPSLEEQSKILSVLGTQTSQIQEAITSTQHQIDLVREYRTRLIADVVTGKLDVRDVVLPDPGPDDDGVDFDELAEASSLDEIDEGE